MDVTVTAHMPGMVARVTVQPGDAVEHGQEVAVLSVMKTELTVTSTASGVVKEVHAKEWDEIEIGSPLLTVETA